MELGSIDSLKENRPWFHRAGLAAYRGFREPLKRIGFDHARWPRTFAFLDVLFDPLGTPASYDRQFANRNPWNYAIDPREQGRHQLAVHMLDKGCGGTRWGRVLEIGCAEGWFTELLSPRSESLLAVDFSSLALKRARARKQWNPGTSFERWDLRKDPVPGEFDLIVVMDVLTSFMRPHDLRAARAKIVDAMRPGDHLLVCDNRQSPAFENTWWGRWLVRGGKWIVRGFIEHPALETMEQVLTETHVLALFRRR